MDANKLLSADLLDLLFEGRNKEYGAYKLRRTYEKRIKTAVIITASLTGLCVGGIFWANAGNFSGTIAQIAPPDLQLTEVATEPEPPVEIPPPVQETPPPQAATIDYAVPDIRPDEEVRPEDMPPEVDQILTAKIALVTQEGELDSGVPVISDVDGDKGVIEVKPPKENEDPIYDVQVQASFKGGTEAWRRFLVRNLRAEEPVDKGAPEGKYTVIVQFVVSKTGKISQVTALTHHGFGMEEEAVRVIKNGPDWTPAQQNGNYVNAYRKQPITFIVASN